VEDISDARIGRSERRVIGVTTCKVKSYEGLNFAVASGEIANASGRFIR
jgi:hypothetical protein